jgi:hypothetical protein
VALASRKTWLENADADPQGVVARATGIALTLLCVMIGWVFFRAPDLTTARGILGSMFGMGAGDLPLASLAGYSPSTAVWIAGFSLLALFGRNSQQLIDGSMARWLDGRLITAPRYAEWLALFTGAMCVGVVLMAIAGRRRGR